MNVLVVYASRHGATRGIAERIAERLGKQGLTVDLRAATELRDVEEHDAFVIGAAAYNGHWLKEAADLVRRNRSRLAGRPVWLFSSGPIGTEIVDDKGRDVLDVSRPHEFEEFAGALQPRDMRVFFGAYDPDAEPVGFAERLGARFTRMATIRAAIPSGDFRDWPQIEAWADGIAHQLLATPVAGGR
jgi:menaquinone-dependent protoporphyrinogen oxidase